MDRIDRTALVGRHTVRLTAATPGVVVSVGNGDFAFTADITGLQTFTEYHEPVPGRPDPSGPRVTNTCTMSTWGWDAEPDKGYFACAGIQPVPDRARPGALP